MHGGLIALIVFGALLGALTATLLFTWLFMSGRHFTRTCAPGEQYKVGDRTYTFPNLVIANRPKDNQRVKILSEEYLLRMRDIYQKVQNVLDECNIEHWVSGGSLISWHRDGALNPCDDDLDAHVKMENREFLWSKEFADKAREHGLRVKTLRVASLKMATREGAAVRLHLKDHNTPAYDLFFEAPYPDKNEEGKPQWGKVDSWTSTTNYKYNKREIWAEDALFPLQKRTIDGLKVYLPNKPEVLLKTQYGDNVMKSNYVMDTKLAHDWPHTMLAFAFKTH